MRQIKFRGLGAGRWRYGYYVHFDNKPNNEVYNSVFCDFIVSQSKYGEHHIPVDPDTIGQFTGLYDKNGKEIYEGDIVRFPVNGPTEDTAVLKTSEVKWNKDLFRFTVLSELWRSEYCIIDGGRVGQMEVIGNMHDNPELLKGGEK